MKALAELLGESSGIEAIRKRITRLLERQQDARRLSPVLIVGETGTGKGLLARMMHRAGPRPDGPFVDVNCAAIPETLLEAEMFGFERGAFTDARRAKPGLFQAANRGTIFLDEVGLLSEGLQAKLLKVLEERSVRRLGSIREEPVDVWILTATNEDLSAAIRGRRFREDLYHRLAVLTLSLPPLRERGDDIVRLAEHFLARECTDYAVPPKTLAADARAALLAYPWPGNVRELANLMERVALLSSQLEVTRDVLELPSIAPAKLAAQAPTAVASSLEDTVRDRVAEVLRQTGWNISRSAALLGISRNTLRARIEKYGLESDVPAPPQRRAARPQVAPASAQTPTPPAAVRWERRRVTLLQARLIAGAPDAQLEVSRALEVLIEKVRSFGGRVEGMSPTGIIAAFGLDATEDAPSRAAHAAMAIQKASARARQEDAGAPAVTIGIHLDPVLVAFGARAAELDVAAMQRAVGVLSALVERGEPGSILVTEAAAPFLERRFELLDFAGGALGRVSVLAGRGSSGLGRHVATFVGRHREIELLWSRLESAIRGQGQIVGISGEAGIGKSRLLYEFHRSVAGKPIGYQESQCVSYGTATPYLPVLDVLRTACSITDADTEQVTDDRVQVALREVGLDPAESGPYLLHLLGIKKYTARLQTVEPDAIKARIFEALRQMLVQRSRQIPLIIAVEDLHWIDTTSEEFFASLAEIVAGSRILLASTYRAGYRPPWIEKSYATQVALQPLAPDDSLRVLQSVLGAERVSDALADLIIAKAEGNPFFVEELARSVREQGGESSSLAVPDTIEEVLLGRIGRLAPSEKRLLGIASVVGKDVPLAIVQVVASMPAAELRLAFERLKSADFLYESAAGPDPEYTFKHTLTLEVAYGGVSPEQRRILHAGIVEAIEHLFADRLDEHTDRLAHHAVRGEVFDKAVDYLRGAGARAFGRGAVEDALERYDQALSLSDRLPRTPANMRRAIDVRVDLHTPLVVLGQISRLVELHGQAEQLAQELDDPPRLWRVFHRISQYSWMEARYRDGLDYARRSLDIATAINDPDGRVLAMHGLAQCHYAVGNYHSANDLFARTVDGPDAERAKRLLAVSVSAYISACSWLGRSLTLVGDLDRALSYSARGILAADESEHPQAQAVAYALAAIPHVYKGEVAQGVALGERALNLCETRGLRLWLPGALANLGWALTASGRVAEGLVYLERGPSMLVALGVKIGLPILYAWWAEALLLAGRLEEARQVAGGAVDAAVASGERGHEAEGRYVAASVLAALDPTASEACTKYEEARAQADELGMRPLLGRCHLGLGEFYRQRGDEAKATQHLRIAVGSFREMGMRLWLEQAEALLSEGRS